MANPRQSRRRYRQSAEVVPFPISKTTTRKSRMGKKAEAVQYKTKPVVAVKLDDLYEFEPLTENQTLFFQHYQANVPAIMCHGVAGTGKTFIALYKALEQALKEKRKRVIIMRSAVQTRDIGYLPGDLEEKTNMYQLPYKGICDDLFGRDKDAYTKLVEQGTIEFTTTTFIRGITLDNCIIIIDEAQNMTRHELSSIFTRLGDHSRIIICGDFRQTDLARKGDQSGLRDFIQITNKMPSFRKIEFGVEDIVRSEMCKEYIIASLAFDDEQKHDSLYLPHRP
jgi:phosphate starvation-inducible protein PhoH